LQLVLACGGRGQCGKCRVRFEDRAPAAGERDRHFFSTAQLDAGWRLACQVPVEAEGRLFIPQSSLSGDAHQIVTVAYDRKECAPDPPVRKAFLKMSTPTLQDSDADLLRLEKAWHEACPEEKGKSLRASLPLLQQLGQRLRGASWEGTVTVRDDELLDFEEGDTSQAAYSLAFDLGTTTLVASLLDMQTGLELALSAEMNPLIAWGDDVISRITAASTDDSALQEMQETLLNSIATMSESLILEAGVSAHHVYELAFAGNTTMEHLFCGFNPSPLGQSPFISLFAGGHSHGSAAFGLPVHDRCCAYFFPVIGGFVGGDTVAALLASDFASLEGTRLLVDAGTNGEIVLGHGDRLWAASTAAGPAFEGARISQGMRAARGAVEGVVFHGKGLSLSVIGGGSPLGICGSGLIDLCGELLRCGLVDAGGRLRVPEEFDGHEDSFPLSALRKDDRGALSFVIYESATGSIALTQKDIRELQLGTAALRTGMTLLLREAGLTVEDLDLLIIAGAFGSYIRVEQGQRTGLIPETLPPEKIRIAGNAALDGARWASLSRAARSEAEALAARIRHIDLSTSDDFAETFALATLFPGAGLRL
jgi:uncharacterized 2Fe-2S/4Fe-4S cluster protein (DUF4445 family)